MAPHHCSDCDLEFSTDADWKEHLDYRVNCKKCQRCDKVLNTPRGKDDHSARVHGTERHYPPVYIRSNGRKPRRQPPTQVTRHVSSPTPTWQIPRNSFLRSKEDLDVYIAEKLQATTSFHAKYGKDIDELATYLKTSKEFPYNVKEIVKAGSMGKGTAVLDNADVDLVVFLNNFKDQQHFRKNIKVYLKCIKDFLVGSSFKHRITITRETQHSVQFDFKSSSGEVHEIDLLPAYDNLGHHSKEQVHREMDKLSANDRYYYSASLTKLQLDYVKEQPAKVKDLIRLMKHWKKTHLKERPPSYGIELLTIDAWEQSGKSESFDMLKGFHSMMQKLQTFGQEWLNNRHGDGGRILLEDPANPYNDVSTSYKHWDKLGQFAAECMEQPLFSDINRQSGTHSWN